MLRTLIAAFALATLIGGSAWLHRETAGNSDPAHVPNPSRRPMQVGVPFCLATSGGRLEFVLPADGTARYLLIIGSLGDPHRVHRVELEAVRTDAPPRIDGVPLARFSAGGRVSRIQFSGKRAGAILNCRGKIEFWTPDPTHATQPTFHLHVTDGPLDDAQQYVAIQSRELARGRHVAVLLDAGEPLNDRLKQTAEEIVRLFEAQVLPRTRRLLGPHFDVNRDGRLTVLLTPWLGKLQGGGTSLGGMVRNADFRADVPAPFSNHCDVLFLNSSVAPGPRLHALLAHEYAHVVTFSRRAGCVRGGAPIQGRRAAASPTPEDDWLSEGLAHVCEHLHHAGWTNLDHRIARFLEAPQKSPLVVANYYESGLWRDDGCRGATFLFLRWCVDQFGKSLLRRLIDGESVGVRNIEQASRRRFEDLFRRWCLALYLAGAGADVQAAIDGSVPRYRSLSLRGRLGKQRLSGPNVGCWKETDTRRTIDLRGTAAAFLEIRSGNAGGRRFHIYGASAARLQVTVLRLPDREPRGHTTEHGTYRSPCSRSLMFR